MLSSSIKALVALGGTVEAFDGFVLLVRDVDGDILVGQLGRLRPSAGESIPQSRHPRPHTHSLAAARPRLRPVLHAQNDADLLLPRRMRLLPGQLPRPVGRTTLARRR